jgi:hypothetical protein
MYASDETTPAERYRLREDLRHIGKRLDKHIDVPAPSSEIGKAVGRLFEAEADRPSIWL